jgi:hypothetical protein
MITQVLESIFLSVVVDVTIAVRWSTYLSRASVIRPKGLPIYLTVHGSDGRVHILSDVVLLEGVPKGVT